MHIVKPKKGNSSPDDISFNQCVNVAAATAYDIPTYKQGYIAANIPGVIKYQISDTKPEELYPFGLCLPDYTRSFKTISRCSSFSESKEDNFLDFTHGEFSKLY